uniref:Uncharacterized protein n=1 Tax=Aplanochytrium stocchinoi TaxID=215587 RepID=A0A7S3LJA4_9STRA
MAENGGVLGGVLHEYGEKLHAFESGEIGSNKVVVVLGGLTDGLLACKYVPVLSRAVQLKGYAVIQPLLSSSYNMFGTNTLLKDVEDLTKLFSYLTTTESSGRKKAVDQVVMVGHSTGCQICVYFCLRLPKEIKSRINVKMVVLQGPISDREALGLEMPEKEIKSLLIKAKSLMEEKRNKEIVHLLYGIAPVNAERFLDLFSKGGRDDMFSSDLSDEELGNALGHMSKLKTIVAVSGRDEYVPLNTYPKLADRLAAAAGTNAEVLFLKNADHGLSSNSATNEFVNFVVNRCEGTGGIKRGRGRPKKFKPEIDNSAKRPRGRPKGWRKFKNEKIRSDVKAPKRGRGRPKGSLNKSKISHSDMNEPKPGRGRPRGSLNKKKRSHSDMKYSVGRIKSSGDATDSDAGSIERKKGRGRAIGSLNILKPPGASIEELEEQVAELENLLKAKSTKTRLNKISR